MDIQILFKLQDSRRQGVAVKNVDRRVIRVDSTRIAQEERENTGDVRSGHPKCTQLCTQLHFLFFNVSFKDTFTTTLPVTNKRYCFHFYVS